MPEAVSKRRLRKFIRGRVPRRVNQTGAGVHGDRRTKRRRDRAAQRREAVNEQTDDE